MEREDLRDLAIRIDAFIQDYDFYEYQDVVDNALDNIEDIKLNLENENVTHIIRYIDDVIDDSSDEGIVKEGKILLKAISDISNKKMSKSLDKYGLFRNGPHGGLSDAVLAISNETGEKVFIKKVNKGQKSIYYTSLKSEVEILEKLKGTRGIPKVIESFEDSKNLYLIEKFIEGKTLAEIIKEDTISLKERNSIYKEILKIVKKIHDKGIVHRDLKPNNIIIDEKNKVHIIDFNISQPDKKEIAFLAGNRSYSPPEQLKLDSIADKKNDVFTLGKIHEKMFGYSLISEMATKENIKERCSLNKLMNEFNKELVNSERLERKYNILTAAREKINSIIKNNSLDAKIVNLDTYTFGEKRDTKVQVLVEYEGKEKEYNLFNAIAERRLEAEGAVLDVNPIRSEESGGIKTYKRMLNDFKSDCPEFDAKEPSSIAELVNVATASNSFKEVSNSSPKKEKELER